MTLSEWQDTISSVRTTLEVVEANAGAGRITLERHIFDTRTEVDGRPRVLDTRIRGRPNDANWANLANAFVRNDLHPTMKPIALAERAIRNSSKSRDTVLDIFGGSGTTLMASEATGRHAALIELDPRYCDVIVKRWQDATQRLAKGEDGAVFNDLTTTAASGLACGVEDEAQA